MICDPMSVWGGYCTCGEVVAISDENFISVFGFRDCMEIYVNTGLCSFRLLVHLWTPIMVYMVIWGKMDMSMETTIL